MRPEFNQTKVMEMFLNQRSKSHLKTLILFLVCPVFCAQLLYAADYDRVPAFQWSSASASLKTQANAIERQINTLSHNFPQEHDTYLEKLNDIRNASTAYWASSEIERAIDYTFKDYSGKPRVLEKYIEAVTRTVQQCKGHSGSPDFTYHSNAREFGDDKRAELRCTPGVDNSSISVHIPEKESWALMLIPFAWGNFNYRVYWNYKHYDNIPACNNYTTVRTTERARTIRQDLTRIVSMFEGLQQAIKTEMEKAERAERSKREAEQRRFEAELSIEQRRSEARFEAEYRRESQQREAAERRVSVQSRATTAERQAIINMLANDPLQHVQRQGQANVAAKIMKR